MKFPKHIRLNVFTFICLVTFSLMGVVFLGLIWYYSSNSQKAAELATEQTEHAHPHPHPSEGAASDGSPAREQASPRVNDASAPATNTSDKKKSNEEKKGGRSLGTLGVINAFQPAIDLKHTNPKLADEKIHGIAEELGDGDPEWTEYYHLIGHMALTARPGTLDGELALEDADRFYRLKAKLIGLTDEDQGLVKEMLARVEWNRGHHDVQHQISPIRNALGWMKENALVEWEVVNKHYTDMLPQRVHPRAPMVENWRTVEQRVDAYYDTFFEALGHLPEDSMTLRMLFESPLEEAKGELLSQQAILQTQTPPPIETETPSMHTWDMEHEVPTLIDGLSDGRSADANEETLQPSAPPQPSRTGTLAELEAIFSTDQNLENTLRAQFSSERSNRAIKTLRQHGPVEGLRRIKENDPTVASEIEKVLPNPQ